MERVFVTRALPEAGLARLREVAAVTVWGEPDPPPRPALEAAVAEVRGILATVTERVDGALLDAAPHVVCVANYAVGYDNVDVPEATRRGVLVTNTPDVLTEATADLAMALLLAVARGVVAGDRLVRAGGWKTWDPVGHLGLELNGATLGIVGLGRIGTAVARRARAFGMRILYTGRRPRPEAAAAVGAAWRPFPDLLAEADAVSLHVPLTPETRGLFDARTIGRMKRGAILVNTARGAVVDPAALGDALRSGHLGGAGLDVTDPEPLPADDPLLAAPNLVVTPHVGSATRVTRTRMAEVAAANLAAALAGEMPPNCVNPDAAGTGRFAAWRAGMPRAPVA